VWEGFQVPLKVQAEDVSLSWCVCCGEERDPLPPQTSGMLAICPQWPPQISPA
jgi:hypothetical protein